MKKTLLLLAAAFCFLAVPSSFAKKKVAEGNTNAIWVWSRYMNDINLDEMVRKDIGHIVLHEKSFEVHGQDSTLAFIKAAKKRGITVHVWMQCCYRNGKWAYPMNDSLECYDQAFYDETVAKAVNYVKMGVEGIHLDYIRFGGTAYKHNYPSKGASATGCITEFCRQISNAIKAVNPDVILSAAVMPEPDSEHYYGQNPEEMGRYIDIFMPMIYRYAPGYRQNGEGWSQKVADWFAEKGAPAQVWAGTTTYRNPEKGGEEDVIPMSADEILKDCRDFNGTKATGIVLFRYGLGEIPDLHNLKK